ncbi:hypothetical protein [Nonomuraea insulae]|uniref:Uncharacterized protein n=1 Tax=Nonomuraea insulae TaxID=1616787 RepID=A0ABW1CHJ9_9ACTN
MGRHENPDSPKDEKFDPDKHKGTTESTGDHHPSPSGKHSDKGKGGKK